MLETESREEQGINGNYFNPQYLSREIILDGVKLNLNTDYMDILEIISILNSDYERAVKVRACLEIFVDNWQDIADGQNAMNALYNFIDCGDPPANVKGVPKEMDWKIDFTAIISDMNKVSKVEDIRSVDYMHWFTFVSIYNSIGEGNLSYRVSIRRKIRKREKLNPDEIDWVNRNPDKIFLKLEKDEDD